MSQSVIVSLRLFPKTVNELFSGRNRSEVCRAAILALALLPPSGEVNMAPKEWESCGGTTVAIDPDTALLYAHLTRKHHIKLTGILAWATLNLPLYEMVLALLEMPKAQRQDLLIQTMQALDIRRPNPLRERWMAVHDARYALRLADEAAAECRRDADALSQTARKAAEKELKRDRAGKRAADTEARRLARHARSEKLAAIAADQRHARRFGFVSKLGSLEGTVQTLLLKHEDMLSPEERGYLSAFCESLRNRSNELRKTS